MYFIQFIILNREYIFTQTLPSWMRSILKWSNADLNLKFSFS